VSYVNNHASDSDTDLLLGDISLSPSVDVELYIDLGYDEMSARLGECFVLPLPSEAALIAGGVDGSNDLRHLKFIQQHIATGRLYLAQTGATGNSDLNAYGEYLISMAHERMESLCGDGALTLFFVQPAPPRAPGGESLITNAPVVVNEDRESGVGSFMDFVSGYHHGGPWRQGGGYS